MSNHAPSPQADKHSSIHMRYSGFGRHAFVLARVCALALIPLALGVFVFGLPAYSVQLRTPCSSSSSNCLDKQLTVGLAQAAQHAGFSLNAYATLIIIITFLSALVCVLVAVLLLWRTSRNWMALLVAALLVSLGTGNLMPQRFLPGAFTLVTILTFLYWLLTLTCGTFVFLLFPNGRFVPRRIRWIMIPHAIVAILIGVVSISLRSQILDLMSDIIWIPFLIISLSAQVYRYWRVSTDIERQQTKVVFFVFAWGLFYLLVTGSLQVLFPWLWHSDSLFTLINNFIGSSLFSLLFPLALGVAVLRYKLYRIDLLINRTLVYTFLSACVISLYVLVVVGLGSLLPTQDDLLLSWVATGLIAILFQPVRQRVQQAINRLMYGERDDPYAVLARLSSRLEATLVPETVLPTIVETVAQTLKLPYVAIALLPEPSSLPAPKVRLAVASVDAEGEILAIAASYGSSTPDLVRVPLIYQTETIGYLLFAARVGEPLGKTDTLLLADLARQAGVAAYAVRLATHLQQLTESLQESRERLVTTREEERRRLRRDLHDGLGSTLASLTFKVDGARNLLTQDSKQADRLLIEARQQAQEAIANIRHLVYNLRPPTLDELGLLSALREHAVHYQQQGLEVAFEAPPSLPPLSAAVEVAAYRIAQEVLMDITRHAQAQHCVLRFSTNAEAFQLEVSDDGKGIAVGHRVGVGLHAMYERLSELGGSCTITQNVSAGTTLRVRLPLGRDARDTQSVTAVEEERHLEDKGSMV